MPREIHTGRDFIFAADDDGGSNGMTFHILPPDPDLAHSILTNEIGKTYGGGPKESADSQALLEATRPADGGFSVKDHLGDGPTQGYMVSINKSTERAFPENSFSKEDIESYMSQHSSEISEPDNYFGAWHDPDSKMVYLDVSRNFRDFDQAMSYAKAHDQIAIFDLSNFSSIYTSRKIEHRRYYSGPVNPYRVLENIYWS